MESVSVTFYSKREVANAAELRIWRLGDSLAFTWKTLNITASVLKRGGRGRFDSRRQEGKGTTDTEIRMRGP